MLLNELIQVYALKLLLAFFIVILNVRQAQAWLAESRLEEEPNVFLKAIKMHHIKVEVCKGLWHQVDDCLRLRLQAHDFKVEEVVGAHRQSQILVLSKREIASQMSL